MEITKKDIEINELKDTQEIALHFGLDYVETTIGRNGYPEELKHAITAETITELLIIEQQINDSGLKTEQLVLHQRDGWSLWNRESIYIQHGMFKKARDNDWYIDVDMTKIKELKEELKYLFYGDNEQFNALIKNKVKNGDYENRKEAIGKCDREIRYFIEQLPEQGCFRVFYDPDKDFMIDYIVSDEDTSYSYDTKNYKLAITIN